MHPPMTVRVTRAGRFVALCPYCEEPVARFGSRSERAARRGAYTHVTMCPERRQPVFLSTAEAKYVSDCVALGIITKVPSGDVRAWAVRNRLARASTLPRCLEYGHFASAAPCPYCTGTKPGVA